MDRPIATSVKDRQLVRERRQRLVRAALKVFIRKGYHRATVREIGHAAGFTQGTIYNYVRSKGDILYLVCDEKVRAHEEALARALEGITDPARRLERALAVLVEAVHAHAETVLLVYRESHALDRRSLHAILARVARLIDMVEAILVDAGCPVSGQPRVAANIVTFLPLIVAMRRWDFERRAVDRRTLDGHLVRFMLLGLGFEPGRVNGDHGGR
jgi:TetR/AcrR family transcriptional regulator, cholesterol catabolism regulator